MDLSNPDKMILLIDKGEYTTSQIERAYTDEIHLCKLNNKPLKKKRAEMNYYLFLEKNKKYVEDYINK